MEKIDKDLVNETFNDWLRNLRKGHPVTIYPGCYTHRALEQVFEAYTWARRAARALSET